MPSRSPVAFSDVQARRLVIFSGGVQFFFAHEEEISHTKGKIVGKQKNAGPPCGRRKAARLEMNAGGTMSEERFRRRGDYSRRSPR